MNSVTAAPAADAWSAEAGWRVPGPLLRARDWLDARGKGAWIVATILAFVVTWPVGLALLAYMIWSKRMFGACQHRRSHRLHHGYHVTPAATGNTAFDAYRQETLNRLEQEYREFQEFLQKLREARDKSEFDAFMDQRGKSDPAE